MADPPPARVTPVILSGGSGTRLWPLSRRGRPKPMLAIAGAETMLRQTAQRVGDRTLYAPPVVVGAADQAEAIEAEVEGLERLILEPCARNTAPAIALAALDAAPDDLLLVLPSDHLIGDPAGFDAAVRRALPFARDRWIVTFGMAPDRPETGYGWIRRGAELADGVFEAARFVEKPDSSAAQAMLDQGGHDWNGGVFLMSARTVIEGLERHAPDVLAAARGAMGAAREEGLRLRPDGEAFAAAPSVSIDYALMEKAERVAVAPADVGWSDVGGWAALHEAAGRDADANALIGEVLALDAGGCLIRSEGPLVAAVGVEGLAIVATADAVLVVPLDQAQRVREIVERLEAEGKTRWT